MLSLWSNKNRKLYKKSIFKVDKMANNMSSGKSKRGRNITDIINHFSKLIEGKSHYPSQDGKYYEAFTNQIINFCSKPRNSGYRQKILEFAKENCCNIGLKNFYRLGEFFRGTGKEDLEITVGGSWDFNRMRNELESYLANNIPSDALVYMVSYDYENGKQKRRQKKINNTIIYPSKGKHCSAISRTIHLSDFPLGQGRMEFYIKEGQAIYAISVELKIETEKTDNGESKFYRMIARPLLNVKYPLEFQELVASR